MNTVKYKITPARVAGGCKFYDGFTVKFKFRYAKFEPSEHPFA